MNAPQRTQNQVRRALRPQLTEAQAWDFFSATEQKDWIESNIFPLVDVDENSNPHFRTSLAKWVESEFQFLALP